MKFIWFVPLRNRFIKIWNFTNDFRFWIRIHLRIFQIIHYALTFLMNQQTNHWKISIRFISKWKRNSKRTDFHPCFILSAFSIPFWAVIFFLWQTFLFSFYTKRRISKRKWFFCSFNGVVYLWTMNETGKKTRTLSNIEWMLCNAFETAPIVFRQFDYFAIEYHRSSNYLYISS